MVGPSSETEPSFETDVFDQGTTRIVFARGALDAATAPAARVPLVEAVTGGFTAVVLDLTETTFVDEAGILTVLDARSHCRMHGLHFTVLPGPPRVQRAFEAAGLEHLSVQLVRA